MGELVGTRVAVVAAMVPELRPLARRLRLERLDLDGARAHRGHRGRHEVVAAVTAMGTAAATDVTRRLVTAHAPDHVLVIGVCGGVDPDLAIGQLVVPEVVVDEATGEELAPWPLGGAVPRGRLLTTDVLHNTADELAALRADGVVAVDMETAAIGRVAEEHGLPWSVFRAVSDRAGDPRVDPAVVGLARADGTADPAAIARFLVTRPWRVPMLATLGRGLNRAVGATTEAALAALDHR